MSIQCKHCGRDYDTTLFEFDRSITCVCGNIIETRSTLKDIKVEICSNCHPFYTGKQKLVDTAGRVERFRRKYKLDKKE